MHRKYPDPIVHPYPHSHHRDQQSHAATVQERAAVRGISGENNRHEAYDPDDDYELEMGLAGAQQ